MRWSHLVLSSSSSWFLVSTTSPTLAHGFGVRSSTLSRSITTSTILAAVNVRTSLDEASTAGAFVRKDAAYRNQISADPSSKFPAEAGRYHLYVSYACPWAHRTLIIRALKGLEDVISVTVVHPIWQPTRPEQDKHCGWIFGDADPETTATITNTDGNGGPFSMHYADVSADPHTGSKSIREVYESVNDEDGKYSVPILYDTKTKTIVNNESSEILRMFNTEFNALAKNPTLDLYPEALRDAIEKVNEWVYPNINNGVYRCGFAKSQEAYDIAVAGLTEAFDKIDEILQKQRYIAGDVMTEADIRLFVTLVRYDEVYQVYFKTNTRSITHTPSILNYCREIYQMPGVAATVNMDHIKSHYFCSHPTLNHYSVIPKGNNFIGLLEQPHDRDTLNKRQRTE